MLEVLKHLSPEDQKALQNHDLFKMAIKLQNSPEIHPAKCGVSIDESTETSKNKDSKSKQKNDTSKSAI